MLYGRSRTVRGNIAGRDAGGINAVEAYSATSFGGSSLMTADVYTSGGEPDSLATKGT